MSRYVVAALYRFVTLDDYQQIKPKLLNVCLEQDIRGTLLLAREGINGTISGTREGIDAVLNWLRSDERLTDLSHKESFTGSKPFFRMKVKLKKEIVTMGVPAIDPNKAVGRYVSPEHWNELISDPEVLLIDTRNDYEVDIGRFRGAQDPRLKTFREFPDYINEHLDPSKHKKVAMYCTGGIRCEKATSYLMEQGFDEVYHLEGGILKYLETITEDQSLWDGECFVFDQRVAVNHHLEKGRYEQCHGCRHPITTEDMNSPDYEYGVSCPHCIEHLSANKRARATERQHQMQLAAERKQAHLGVAMSQKRNNGSTEPA